MTRGMTRSTKDVLTRKDNGERIIVSPSVWSSYLVPMGMIMAARPELRVLTVASLAHLEESHRIRDKLRAE